MELMTERLLLRDFVEDDWPAVLEYQRDPRYLRYYEWTG
jgi:[ribosomal protein S5]-alanine N-acetyltransferase